MLNDLRDDLKPTSTMRVYDAVSEAGIDVSDWDNPASSRSPAQNPKYCYRWAFEGGSQVLLCLWYKDLEFSSDEIEYQGNARDEQRVNEERANDQRDSSLKLRYRKWASSAYEIDEIVKLAYREKRVVRVAIVDTKKTDLKDHERASADYRLLDREPWCLMHYDMQTGAFLLRRGAEPLPVSHEELEFAQSHESKEEGDITPQSPSIITADSYGIGVADQFVGNETPGRSAISGFVWERSALVRQAVLARSQGRCEYCGRPGFLKENGETYIETHHIVPLSEDGPDVPNNVIALCPEHHRQAHFGASRDVLKGFFLKALAVAGTEPEGC